MNLRFQGHILKEESDEQEDLELSDFGILQPHFDTSGIQSGQGSILQNSHFGRKLFEQFFICIFYSIFYPKN
jgi:hypothetical protein